MSFAVFLEGGVDQSGVVVSKTRVSRGDVFSAWFEGAMGRCLTYCDALETQGDGTYEATLLRARALLRLDRATDALTALESIRSDSETELDTTRRLLVAAALIRLDDPQRGLRDLLQLRARECRAQPTTRAEIALNIGLAHYALRDPDAADASLDEVPVEADVIHARSLEYKGWVADARGDHRAAAKNFTAALARLDACQRYDRFVEIKCTQALVHLAVDGLEHRLWETVAARRAKVTRELSSLSYQRFWLALGVALFENDVEGRPIEAAVEARRAYDLAPTPALRALALCARASIARLAREPVAQLDHVQAAVDALAGADAGRLRSDERFVSLAIAEELANAGRIEEARSHFHRYRALPNRDAMFVIGGDRRREAYEQLVEAQIAEAESRKPEAIGLYRRVVERSTTSSVRYGLVAAIRLGALTGSTGHLSVYGDLAAREVRGSSWIHATLKQLRFSGTLSNLTPVQGEHLALICQGHSNGAIARIRGRSENTVRNQVSALFEIFGVRSRAELTAEYLRQTSVMQA